MMFRYNYIYTCSVCVRACVNAFLLQYNAFNLRYYAGALFSRYYAYEVHMILIRLKLHLLACFI